MTQSEICRKAWTRLIEERNVDFESLFVGLIGSVGAICHQLGMNESDVVAMFADGEDAELRYCAPIVKRFTEFTRMIVQEGN